MANTKPVGVAYEDQVLNGAVIDNSVIGGTTAVAGTFSTMTCTTAVVGGNTLSGTELGYVDGITPGTVAVDKAIVPTTNKHIDALVISDGGLALGSGAGTAVTATAAELNYTDVTTLGTLQASKAWTSDASLDTVMPTGGKLTVQSGGDITLESGSTLDVSGTFEIGNVAMTATAAQLNVLAGVTAGQTAASKAVVLDAAESLVWATTDSTASETVTLSIQDTRTGAGATGWAQKLELVSNVALGAYANAGYNLVTFGASGAVVGLAAGVCGEVELSAGTTAGTYAALEAELTANAAVSTGTDTAFLYANIAGSNSTGKTTVNTNAHMFMLGTGVVDTTDGLFDVLGSPQAVTASARLRIKVGNTLYYLPVCASAALTS